MTERREDGTERRLVQLEVKVTYQDDTIEQLNQVIIELREQLERLERRVVSLEARQWEGSGHDPKTPNEPPPHY